LREILSAFFAAKLFGTISQNIKSKNVMIQVASQTMSDSSKEDVFATPIASCVARAAM